MNLNNLKSKLSETINKVRNIITTDCLSAGKQILEQDICIILSQSKEQFNIIVEPENIEISLRFDSQVVYNEKTDKDIECIDSIAPINEE